MPSVYIKTYGCQMNERDSEQVAAQLIAKGYTLVDSEAAADVILLNTCSVRDMAEQKAIGKMANIAAEVRRSRPEVVLGFLGCMAQSRGQQLIDRLPDVDLVLGTQKFHRAADYVDDLLQGRREKIVDTDEEVGSQSTIREHLLNGVTPRQQVTAFVSIMQGCNQHCTFCIVPFTRGEERSRTIPDIVSECRELVERGVREITLLGQIVTSFGRREIPRQDGRSAFVQLIEAVHCRSLLCESSWASMARHSAGRRLSFSPPRIRRSRYSTGLHSSQARPGDFWLSSRPVVPWRDSAVSTTRDP